MNQADLSGTFISVWMDLTFIQLFSIQEVWMATHLLYSTKPSAVHLNTMRKQNEYKRQTVHKKWLSSTLRTGTRTHLEKWGVNALAGGRFPVDKILVALRK